MRQTKGLATKTRISCPNIIKLYNNSMGGVDIVDQKTAAYRNDRKNQVNSHIVYMELGNDISLLNFQNICFKYFHW